ncbi:MAG: DnaA N-terminal domain-containing protein, partial [Microcystis sp.]
MDSSAQQLWHNLLERLKLLLTRPAFETWFQTATVKEWQNDRLVIQAANP